MASRGFLELFPRIQSSAYRHSVYISSSYSLSSPSDYSASRNAGISRFSTLTSFAGGQVNRLTVHVFKFILRLETILNKIIIIIIGHCAEINQYWLPSQLYARCRKPSWNACYSGDASRRPTRRPGMRLMQKLEVFKECAKGEGKTCFQFFSNFLYLLGGRTGCVTKWFNRRFQRNVYCMYTNPSHIFSKNGSGN